MIELVFTGGCEGCNQADVEVEKIDTFYGESEYLVRCIHENACERIREMQGRTK